MKLLNIQEQESIKRDIRKLKKEYKEQCKKLWELNQTNIIKIINHYYDLGWRYKSIVTLLNINNFKTITGKDWKESNLINMVKILKLPKRLIRRNDFNEANNTIETKRIDLSTINKILNSFDFGR